MWQRVFGRDRQRIRLSWYPESIEKLQLEYHRLNGIQLRY